MEISGMSKQEVALRLLEVIEKDVVPLTTEAVAKGNKLFGAAILRLSDLSLVVASTNKEIECPLWHGEVACIKAYWELPEEGRPQPSDCMMLATHEPCSMCVSAITWAGFPEIHFLFSMEDSRDAFNIPHDLRIFKEVFSCERATRENAFWKAYHIPKFVEALPDPEVSNRKVTELRATYAKLSELYQESKKRADTRIPLA